MSVPQFHAALSSLRVIRGAADVLLAAQPRDLDEVVTISAPLQQIATQLSDSAAAVRRAALARKSQGGA